MMSDIRKIDFYCGAFLSYLVKNDIPPTLFEAGDNGKIVKFQTNYDYYKIYIKYSTCRRNKRTGDRLWKVIFTDNEMELVNGFSEKNRKLLFIIVCTDPGMTESEFAVIDFEYGLKCLGNDPVNEKRRISVFHKKYSPYMIVYGTAIDKEDGKLIFRDYDKYFMEKAE